MSHLSETTYAIDPEDDASGLLSGLWEQGVFVRVDSPSAITIMTTNRQQQLKAKELINAANGVVAVSDVSDDVDDVDDVVVVDDDGVDDD